MVILHLYLLYFYPVKFQFNIVKMRFSLIPILFLTTGVIAAPIQDSSNKNPNHVAKCNTKLSNRSLERRNENYRTCLSVCLAGGVFGALTFCDITIRDVANCAGVCEKIFGPPDV